MPLPWVYAPGTSPVGVLTTVVYFDNFESAVPSNLTPIHLPGRAVQFYFQSLGDVLGVRLSSGGAEADVVAAFGCVIFVLALYTLHKTWEAGVARMAASRHPVLLAARRSVSAIEDFGRRPFRRPGSQPVS